MERGHSNSTLNWIVSEHISSPQGDSSHQGWALSLVRG